MHRKAKRNTNLQFIYLIIYSLFNDVFSTSDYTVSNGSMICKLTIGKDVEGSSCDLIQGTNPSICLEGMRKTTKNLSQDSWSPG
jgi:hypothetical protein